MAFVLNELRMKCIIYKTLLRKNYDFASNNNNVCSSTFTGHSLVDGVRAFYRTHVSNGIVNVLTTTVF